MCENPLYYSGGFVQEIIASSDKDLLVDITANACSNLCARFAVCLEWRWPRLFFALWQTHCTDVLLNEGWEWDNAGSLLHFHLVSSTHRVREPVNEYRTIATWQKELNHAQKDETSKQIYKFVFITVAISGLKCRKVLLVSQIIGLGALLGNGLYMRSRH